MLDPTRYSLDAATVGFRKRMGLEVDWKAFNEAMQTQNEAVKVRRELIETPINEVHVMGGERYGYAGNSKFNEQARQERQMNGYPLRSFLATGGPLVLPSKRGDPLLATQGTMGHSVFVRNSADMGLSTSSFSEPLHDALDNNALSMGLSGIAAMSEAISNPFQRLQFMLNMHESQASIQGNQAQHENIKGYNQQGDIKETIQQEEQKLRTDQINLKRQRSREEAGREEQEGGRRPRAENRLVQEMGGFDTHSEVHFEETEKVPIDVTARTPISKSKYDPSAASGSSEVGLKGIKDLSGSRTPNKRPIVRIVPEDSDAMGVAREVEESIVEQALDFSSPGAGSRNVNPSLGVGVGSNRANQAQGNAFRDAARARAEFGLKLPRLKTGKESGSMAEIRKREESRAMELSKKSTSKASLEVPFILLE